MTGQPDWGLARGAQGKILGIYSRAPGQPIQQTGFEPHRLHFEKAQRYSDWVFAPQSGSSDRID